MLRDLSHPITSGMPVYPGDPSVQVTPALTLDRDGVAVAHLDLGSHTGTHMDAPSHTVPGGRTIDEVDLAECTGPARVINVPAVIGRPLHPREEISWEQLGLDREAPLPRIVVIATGWDAYFGDPEYADHPFLAADTATGLWNAGMRVLAIDAFSPDATGGEGFPVHEIVLGGDGLIVENLRGATALQSHTTVSFFPLHLHGVDGSPVRAVAW